MILEDFVMLGTTVPEPMKKTSRVSVCSAGFSAERGGLVRLYPLAMRNIPTRWGVYRVAVEKPPAQHDSRVESMKIKGGRAPGEFDRINDQFSLVGKSGPNQLRAQLSKLVVSSVKEANERRMSLAIVEPSSAELTFSSNVNALDDNEQTSLFHELVKAPRFGAKRFAHVPRVDFADDSGRHCLQLRDWGCYEFMRKNPGRWRELNPQLNPGSSLLIGNLSNQRTAWIVIAVLNGLRDIDAPLFPMEAIA